MSRFLPSGAQLDRAVCRVEAQYLRPAYRGDGLLVRVPIAVAAFVAEYDYIGRNLAQQRGVRPVARAVMRRLQHRRARQRRDRLLLLLLRVAPIIRNETSPYVTRTISPLLFASLLVPLSALAGGQHLESHVAQLRGVSALRPPEGDFFYLLPPDRNRAESSSRGCSPSPKSASPGCAREAPSYRRCGLRADALR